MGKKQTVSIPNIQELARAAALEALKLQKEEERQRIRKNRFHNTELLLINYLSLVEHFEKAQEKASEIQGITESFGLEDMYPDDIVIMSIKRSKIRTKIMINQIDTCMEILKVRTNDKGQPEKYEVIQKLYLDKEKSSLQWTDRIHLTAEEIHCGESSVRRWRNEMINELGILLFGVDGLRLEV